MTDDRDNPSASDRQQRLDEVLAGFMRAIDAGQTVDGSDWVARHPEFAGELREFFTKHRRVEQLVGPLRQAAARVLHVRCPHCHNPIELLDEAPLSDISCPSCGSSFSLVGEETLGHASENARPLGHFELLDRVGIGQFGTVWKARDTKLDRTVAIKIPRNGRMDAAQTEMFLRDARAAAQLKHPNIVGVHEVGKQDDTIYIVSDFIQGATLKEWTAAKPLAPREAAGLCVKLAKALHHAHEAGVIHRDLKPGNIMLDAGGEPHIVDFGLAKREAGEVTMTVEGQILGTPAYMPPEQARGEGFAVDRRADIYSLGVVLFELLTGELPFRGEKQMLIVQILDDDPPGPRKLNSSVPRDLETICLKCLEKEPAKRYGSGLELAHDLERFLSGAPIQARPASRWERSWRWCRRKPAAAALIGVSTLATAIIVTGLVVSNLVIRHALRDRTQALEVVQAKEEETRQALAAKTRALADRTQAFNERTAALEDLEAALLEKDAAFQDRTQALSEREAALDRERWAAYVQTIALAEMEWRANNLTRCNALLEQCPVEYRSFEWFYLKDLCNYRGLRTFPYAVGPLSSNGRALVRREGSLTVVDVDSGREISSFELVGPDENLSIAPNGRFVVAYGGGRTTAGLVDVYDSATRECVLALDLPRVTMLRAAVNSQGDRLVTFYRHYPAGARQSTQAGRIWELPGGKELTTGDVLPPSSRVAGFSPDGRKLVLDGQVLDLKGWKSLYEFEEPIRHFAFTPDGKVLATAAYGPVINIRDASTGQVVSSIAAQTSYVESLALGPRGKRVAVGRPDGAVQVFDVANGREVALFRSMRNNTSSVAFTGDGQRLAVVSGGSIQVWEATHRPEVLVIPSKARDARRANEAVFSPDGRLVGTIDPQFSLVVYDAQSRQQRCRFPGKERYSVAFSPDNRYVASAGYDHVMVWELETGEQMQFTPDRGGWSHRVAFSHDGRLIAAAHDRGATVWEFPTGRRVRTMEAQPWFGCVAFSPDDRLLAACGTRGGKVWNTASWEELYDLRRTGRETLVFSKDGRWIVTCRRPTVWDAATGKQLLTIPTNGLTVSISPDGKRLAVPDGRLVRIWDIETQQAVFALRGHYGDVQTASFSPDGRHLVSTSQDGTTRVWGAPVSSE